MKEPAVADSACLIALERIDRLDLLAQLFEPLVVPPAVEREFGAVQPGLRVEAPTNATLVSSLGLLVGEGEAEAIALAAERAMLVVLDDRHARNVARQLGLRVVGTVGCLLRAKQEGVISAVKPLIEELESQGFYLSDALKAQVLRMAGE